MNIVKFFMIGLSFETCFQSASVSLFIEGEVQTLIETRKGGQSDSLSKMTESLLISNKIGTKDLNFLLSNKGPGSFTGIRIGLSFMEGLSFGLQSSNLQNLYLTSFASSLGDFPESELSKGNEILVILKAIRETFYIQVFSNDLKPLKSPEYKTLEEVKMILKSNNYRIFGNFEGFEEFASIIILNAAKINSENNIKVMLKYNHLITRDKTPFYFREAIGGGF